MSLSSLDKRSSLPDVNRRIKEIADANIAHEALKPKGRPLETKARYEKLAGELSEKQTIVDPGTEKQKELDVAKRTLFELMTPKISPEGRQYADVKFFTGLNDLDSLIDGVIEQLDKRGLWTKEEMREALKADHNIQYKAQFLDSQRRVEVRRDFKRLFLEAYLAELEATGFTNPEEAKKELKERLSYIEESLFEEFWKETISSEDVLLPVIEKIGDGIENDEVRETFTEMLRSGDINQIFSFLGEQRDILDHTFSKELLPALRFVLSQMFEKKSQKGEYPNKDAFASLIKFSDSFLSFAPLATEFYHNIALRYWSLREQYGQYDTSRSLRPTLDLYPSLREVLNKYTEHLLPLSRADRKIVDRLKKFYFKDTSGHHYYNEDFEDKMDRWSLILNKNRMKKFDESHMVLLMRRAALELFQSQRMVNLYQLRQTGEDLQFISRAQAEYFQALMEKDPQTRFLSGYNI